LRKKKRVGEKEKENFRSTSRRHPKNGQKL